MVNSTRAFFAAMTSLQPPFVRGMTVLDRARFARDVVVPVVKVRESNVASVVPQLKNYLLKLDNFKPVQLASSADNQRFKHVFLNPDKVTKWLDLQETDREKLVEKCVNESNFETKCVTLTYENWKTDDIFKAVLPEDEQVVSGFSLIGHIVHLNLKNHLLPYKSLIGQVLLDKVKVCRTVVNKSNSIYNTYRNFTMEVLAGEEDFNVSVKENNCTFQFDFSNVYWNPRLGKEHERILQILQPGDVLFDVFCGVGPFAIPAARKKCTVFANDLNPESHKWLIHNAKLNKVKCELFKAYNLDGRDFIKLHFKDYVKSVLCGSVKMNDGAKIHVTMNLPALAVEFLDCFQGLLSDFEPQRDVNIDITVHVYCFTFGDDINLKALEMVNKNLGVTLGLGQIVEVLNVRNVAPNKEMMRVSFVLSKDMMLGKNLQPLEYEPPLKKKCTE